MARSNPTKTLTIEKNWRLEINRRWSRFSKLVVRPLKGFDNEFLNNREDPFVMSASQQRTYIEFLRTQIDQILLGSTEPPNWQAQYQLQSYERGLESTRQQLISQGGSIQPTETERLAAQGMRPLTATPSIGAAGLQPIHQDALQFLTTRSYESLKKWTDAFAVETRTILVDAVEQGQSVQPATKHTQHLSLIHISEPTRPY